MKMALSAVTLFFSVAHAGWAATPICGSVISDLDGDGWGWENNQSCRISQVSGSTAQCVDTDPLGDGWGWDGANACRVNAVDALVKPSAQPAVPSAYCVDTDPVGDGWGWDGARSCRVAAASTAAPATPSEPVVSAASVCIDTDPVGDGWGWDGASSCRVDAASNRESSAPAAPERAAACVDTDPVGDGWGWDGVSSCRTEVASPRPAVSPVATATCVDTDPVGDGWGWDGQASCRIDGGESATVGETSDRASDWQSIVTADGSRASARHESGAVALGDKLYLLGGRGSRPVDVYDRAANKWYQLGSLPMEMHHFQPVALNGKIYVLGAMTCCFPNESTIDNVWVLDVASGNWSVGATIPADRRRGSAAAALYNNRIYLVGGNTRGHAGGAVAWFDEFNPATGQWRRLADAPHARDHAGAVVVAGKLAISSGRQTSQPDTFGNTVAATDVYDFASGRWSTAASIPTQRGGAMVAALGDEMLVIGGESNAQYRAHNQVEAFDVGSGSWRALAPLNTGRHSGGAAVLSDGVHVVAGASNRGGGSEIRSHERMSPQ